MTYIDCHFGYRIVETKIGYKLLNPQGALIELCNSCYSAMNIASSTLGIQYNDWQAIVQLIN
jgi:hypothetical protein